MVMTEKRIDKCQVTINPMGVTQTLGAVIAFLGIDRSVPLMHGCQGCTAFAKALFVNHFREPAFFQTTALSETDVIMDGRSNILSALTKVFEKESPDLVGLITTGLSEVKGDDVKSALSEFSPASEKQASVPLISVSTPDYGGSLEKGFSKATSAVIKKLVKRGKMRDTKRVNLLPGFFLTPGDVGYLKRVIRSFGLTPYILPDLSGSLGGKLRVEMDFIQRGGIRVRDIKGMARSVATLSIGRSMAEPAKVMREETGIESFHFDTLYGLESFDNFLKTLGEIGAAHVPEVFGEERERLLDAMVDSHFYISGKRFALALEPDLLLNMATLLSECGGQFEILLSSSLTPELKGLKAGKVIEGGLFELESKELDMDLVFSDSNALFAASRHDVPLIRMGFPVTDRLGGPQRIHVGYEGMMKLIFETGNCFLEEKERQKKV